MTGRLLHNGARRRIVALACASLASVGVVRPRGDVPGQTPEIAVRFHHLHFRSSDPAAAMGEAVGALGGTRVILQGLGVGVRIGDQYLLFDRAEEAAAEPPRPAAAAYAAALSWLEGRGVAVVPRSFNATRVACANTRDPLDHLAFAADDLPRIVAALKASGVEPVRATEDSALFAMSSGESLEIVRDTDRPDAFWCPMHPDVRSPSEGKCPLCAMALVAIPPPRLGDYRVDVTQVPKDGGRGTKALRFVVRDPETGEVVPAFTEVHERVFHLFIISRDLSYFAHEHPVRAGDAFELAVDLPPGAYVVVADFLPSAGTPQMVQQAIVTPGYTASPFVSNAALEVDAAERVVDGLRIRVDSADVRSGRAGLLRFVVSDAASGAPVTDLEPYLGAPGHLLIANPDLTETIHAHPEGRTAGGPDVLFGPVIPSPGLYKLWVQVQRRGRVITAPFVVRVP